MSLADGNYLFRLCISGELYWRVLGGIVVLHDQDG